MPVGIDFAAERSRVGLSTEASSSGTFDEIRIGVERVQIADRRASSLRPESANISDSRGPRLASVWPGAHFGYAGLQNVEHLVCRPGLRGRWQLEQVIAAVVARGGFDKLALVVREIVEGHACRRAHCDLATMALARSRLCRNIAAALLQAGGTFARDRDCGRSVPATGRLPSMYQVLTESGSSSVQHFCSGKALGRRQSWAMRSRDRESVLGIVDRRRQHLLEGLAAEAPQQLVPAPAVPGTVTVRMPNAACRSLGPSSRIGR